MRKLIFIGFIAVGALIGWISVMNSDWGTRLVMMGIGALFMAPIGGALAGIGKKRRSLAWSDSRLPSDGTSSKDMAANYWRDEGHPPFAKPGTSEGEMHRWDRGSSG
jgi:hypothetical protein